MANPLPNEKELFEQIKTERITVEPGIWDLLYHCIGDDITAINLLCAYYLCRKEPVPVLEAKKILVYTRDIRDIIRKITMNSSQDFPFPKFKDNIPLHPVIKDMFTHYIGNDVHSINFIVCDTIDPVEPNPVSSEIIQKVLSRTHSIKEFMERLRQATSPQ
ncbi:MAG: hypothetical protein ABIH40_00495 [Candidatus Omnitrophota bacterium]